MNLFKWFLNLILILILIIFAFKLGGLFINIVLCSIFTIFIVDILFIRKKFL
ncbi:hypothetical protein EZN00_01854 [Clostridium tyrobutyricum]|nr:hypothetical protein EZN00_01854 [Clostridium tyrobutyricum]